MNKLILFGAALLLSVLSLRAKTITTVAPGLDADFTSDVTVVCAGDSVHYSDLTTENPTGWTWTFDGGSPNTSVLQNPVIAYNTPGVYTVHLKSNNGDEGDEEIKVEYIKVLPAPSSLFDITSAVNQCNGNNSYSFVNLGSTSGTHFWGFPGGSPINSAAVNPAGIVFTGAGVHFVSHKVTDDGCSSTTVLPITIFSSPTALTVSTTASNCAGSTGTITIGATTGGTAPFVYSVNGSTFTSQTSYTGFAPGTYSITVKDVNGCTFTRTATVASTGGPVAIVMVVTPATCSTANGVVTITSVTGGVSPFTYSVDNSAFGFQQSYSSLAPGIHTVRTKDANGCIIAQNINILNTQPTAVATTTTASDCAPANGTLTLGAVTGGRSPYSFSIDGGSFTTTTNYTGLPGGFHTVVVKDITGCSSQPINVTIAVTPSPTALAVTTGSSACSASTGSLTIGAVTGGTAPFTYAVNAGAFTGTTSYTALPSGTYTVVVKDVNGCTFSTSATIANTAPTAASITTVPSSCTPTGSISIGAVTGGVAPFVYSVNNSSFTSATAYNNRPAGTYTVAIKDFNGCVLTQTVTIGTTAPTALAVSTTSTVCGGNTGTVTIGAATGGVAPFTYSFNGGAFSAATNFTALAAGIYTVVIRDANGCTFTTTATVGSSGGPTGLVVSNIAATCGNANGSITVTGSSGGTAPFTYSLDNGAFTASVSFTNVAAGTHVVRIKDANGCILPVSTTVPNAAGPTDVTLTSVNASCGNANGTITVGAVTGGTAPFTYSLNGGSFTAVTSYTTLAAGTYTVTVKDANNCTFSKTRTITNQAGPTAISFNFRHSGCSGSPNSGFITVTGVTGGTVPYTYSFNGSAFSATTSYTNLAAGTYTLTAKDANGCTVSQTVTINAVTQGPTNYTFSQVNPGCGLNNGSLTITSVTGGTAPYTYILSPIGYGTIITTNPNITGLAAGSYPVNIRDNNGCEIGFGTTPLLVTPGGPSATSVSTTGATCQQANGSVTINSATGGVSPYQYSVNGGAFTAATTITGIAGGTSMPLVVKDANGCTFTKAVLVSNTGITPAKPSVSQSGFLLTSSASTGNQWFLNGVAVSGATGQTHFAQLNGSYTVVRTSGGCSSAPSDPVVIANGERRNNHVDTAQRIANEVRSNEPGDAPVSGHNAITVYPNPNDGTFTLAFDTPEAAVGTIEVFNVFGQVVFTEQVTGVTGVYTKQLDLREYGAGIYTVVLTSGKERSAERIVVH